MAGAGLVFSHGYLAVDFFFMLSGFVIAHAYEQRLREPGSLPAFLRDRIIRLHPLLLLSIVPRAAELIASMIHGAPIHRYPLLTLASGAVPFPAFWIDQAQKFPLNAVSWSLFWELAVNLAFALVAPRLSNRLLGIIVAAAVTGAIAVSLINHGHAHPDMSAGFRAFAGFAVGVALLRVHRTGRINLGVLGAAAPLVLLLAFIAVPSPGWLSRFYDPAAAFLLFPLIVLASARRQARFPALCAWLGGLSYPLYVLHGPWLLWLGRPIVSAVIPNPVMGALALGAIAVIVALIAWKFYDEPVRAMLRRRFRPAPLPRDTPAS